MSVIWDKITKFYAYPVRLRHWKESLLAGFLIAFAGMYLGWLFLLAVLFLVMLAYVFDLAPQYSLRSENVTHPIDFAVTQEDGLQWPTLSYADQFFFAQYAFWFSATLLFCAGLFLFLCSDLIPIWFVDFFSDNTYSNLLYFVAHISSGDAERGNFVLPPEVRDSITAHILNTMGVGAALTPVVLFSAVITVFFLQLD